MELVVVIGLMWLAYCLANVLLGALDLLWTLRRSRTVEALSPRPTKPRKQRVSYSTNVRPRRAM